MDYIKAIIYAEKKLHALNNNLTYHNFWHTKNDVLPASLSLAKLFNLNDEDIYILKTAVFFHDLGYLEQYDTNEHVAVRFAKEYLPQCGYTYKQIEKISRIILSTEIPQKPKTLLEKIICDADLDSLWRPDFLVLSEKLREEVSYYKKTIPEAEWLYMQINFLENHNYHTDVNTLSREKGKINNITLLKNKISRLGCYVK